MSKKKAFKNARSGLQLVATPYDISAPFWYFSSVEEFDEKYAKRLPVEEYEIDFIDGDDFELALFNAMKVNQATVHEYFEKLDEIGDMREDELAALHFATDHLNLDLDDALDLVDRELRVTEGDAKEHAEQYIDNMGGVGELGKDTLETYFDYEKFGRDIRDDIVNSRIEDARYDARRSGEDEDEAEQAVIDEYDAIDDEDLGLDFARDVGFENIANAEFYFDVDAFARDMELNGDVTEFEFMGRKWTTDYR